MLAGIAEPVTDKTAAFIGTALGDHIEQAYCAVYPKAIRQAEVSLWCKGTAGGYTLVGHPDIIDPRGVIIDVKTTRGLSIVRRNGPSQQQQFQRHCYALAAFGLFDATSPWTDVKVANVWFDRAGDETYPYVHMEPFSPEVVAQAGMFIDDLVYAYLHDEAARKEPPREVCAKVCGSLQGLPCPRHRRGGSAHRTRHRHRRRPVPRGDRVGEAGPEVEGPGQGRADRRVRVHREVRGPLGPRQRSARRVRPEAVRPPRHQADDLR